MKNKKTSPFMWIVQIALLAVIAFGVFWGVKNFDQIKAGLAGTNLYTIEAIEEARAEERKKWEDEKAFYESYMQSFQGILSQEQQKYNSIVAELETERSSNNLNKNRIEILETEAQATASHIASLEALIQELQNENFNLTNERNYYQYLLEAFENQDKVIITFYVDGVVHAVSIVNPGEALSDLPYAPIKEDYTFDKWLINGQPLANQTFTQNSEVHASFVQIRTPRLDYEFFTNEFGRVGYKVTGSKNALVTNNTVRISEFYNDGVNGEYPIIEIGESAFEKGIATSGDFELRILILPEGLEVIGDRAFKNTNIQAANELFSLNIPATVRHIGKEAFTGIFGLRHITFASGSELKTIDDAAFRSSYLNEIVLPNSVKSIGNYAFQYNKLTQIILPDQLTTIGVSAFANNQITSVVMNINLITIGGGAFSDNLIESIVIPRRVQTIGTRAFANNKLTSVTLGESVKTIEYQAFVGNQLTSVNVPLTVTTLRSNAFDLGVEIIRN